MIGSMLGNRYLLVREIGRGGMGVVYQARDPLLERDVAVKLIAPFHLSDDAVERFRRETLTIANLDHPSIVGVYDTGVHDGSMFFVMPLIRGTSLRKLLREAALTYEDVVDVGIAVADALDYSHTRGVVHRDVKPENILVDRDEGQLRVRITDFGLAKATQVKTEDASTEGVLVGTISYVSPEQVAREKSDERSDIYSLGTVLYEALVGEAPFEGDIASVLYRILHEPPIAPTKRGLEIDRELERVVLQCLEKLPGRRPQRARDVAAALRRIRDRITGEQKLIVPVRHGREDSQTLRYDPFSISTFVDRERELAMLQERLQSAIHGECQLVMIGGEAGVGKTRLLDELQRIARAGGIRSLRGRFVEHDRGFPYQGYCELIQGAFRYVSNDSAPPDLSDIAPDLLALFPVLADIDELRSISRVTSSKIEPDRAPEDRLQIFELLARAISRIGGGNTLIVVLEDLHAAEVSLDALQYIVRRLGATPTLFVGTYRTSEVDKAHPVSRTMASFEGDTRCATITLEALRKSDHRDFVEATLGFTRLDPKLADKLYEATEGNPYFTKELIRSLVDSGSIRQIESGVWALTEERDVVTEHLPATIQQAVERRIERLSDDLKKILSAAAVVGRTFELRDLAAVLPAEELDDAIDHLIASGFLEQEKNSRADQFSFSSGVVRDVLYAALPRRRRKSIHRAYAEYLEQRSSGRKDRAAGELLHHFAAADVSEKVVEYGLEHARRALAAFTPEETIRACRMVIDFVEDDEGRTGAEGEARMLMALAYRAAGNIEASMREFGEAARLLENVSSVGPLLNVVLTAAQAAWEARKIDETNSWVIRGCEIARAAGDRAALAKLLPLGATVANLRADYELAQRYLREAEQLSPRRTVDEQIAPGGTLTVALPIEFKATHPAMIYLVEEEEVFGNVFETLVTRDANGALLPLIAERWEVHDEGRVFTFKIREGIRFHDGVPLDAREVKQSIESSIRLSAARLAPAFSAIRGAIEFRDGAADRLDAVSVVGTHLLRVELSDPLPIYAALLTHEQTAIARAAADGQGSYVGTGPFRVEQLTYARVRLARNDDYHGTAPRLDALEFRYVGGAAEIAARFRAGEFDVARDLLPDDLDALLRDRRLKASFAEAAKKDVYFILINTHSPVAANQELRRALLYSVRTDDLVWRTLGRFAEPAQGVIPPGVLGHDPVKRRSPIPAERARDLLKQSGLSIPVRLNASVHPMMQDRYAALTQALFKHWSEIGIEISVVTTDMQSYLQTRTNVEGIDLRIGRFLADYDDPDNFTYGLFDSARGLFRHHLKPSELDPIGRAARSVADPAERERLYRRFESVLAHQDIFLPLFHDIDYRLSSPAVRGLELRATPPYVNYASLGKSRPSGSVQSRRSGGVLTVPIAGEVQSLDPASALLVSQAEVMPAIFETLTRQTSGAQIAPALAAEFAPEERGRVFRFRLRDDVRFHDGRRLTSSDVQYSFERLLRNSDSSRRIMLGPIRGARQVMSGARDYLEGFHIRSPLEFAIELENPLSFFPALLAYDSAAIVPEGATDFTGAHAVGTGPFRVAKFQPGVRLELEANPYYWRKGFPRVDKIVFVFGLLPREILAGFRDGRFALAWDLYPHDVETLRHDPEFAGLYHELPLLSTAYIAFNVHDGPLSDRAARERLVAAVRREELVRDHLHRLAVPAHSLIPPGLLGYEPTSAGRQRTSSDDSIPLEELKVVANSIYATTYSSFASELIKALSREGFATRNVAPSRDEYFAALRSGECDMALTRWVADYPDADTFLHDILHSKNGIVGRLAGSEEIDRLIERGRGESNPVLRHHIYREAEEVIADRALLLPLFHEQAYRFVRPEVENFALNFSAPLVSYEELSIGK